MQGYKIIPPKGMECYLDGSEIKFKPIEHKPKISCYNDVLREIFKGERGFYINSYCVSQEQTEKVLAINKLLNVAKYLNNGWTPNWSDSNENKYYFYINSLDRININWAICDRHDIVYFRTKELAEEAIVILGVETIRLALTTDY